MQSCEAQLAPSYRRGTLLAVGHGARGLVIAVRYDDSLPERKDGNKARQPERSGFGGRPGRVLRQHGIAGDTHRAHHTGWSPLSRLRLRHQPGNYEWAEVRLPGGSIALAEIHMYEATGIRRRESKIKRY